MYHSPESGCAKIYVPSSHFTDANVPIRLIDGFSISTRHAPKNPVFDFFPDGFGHRAWSFVAYLTGIARISPNAVRLEMGLWMWILAEPGKGEMYDWSNVVVMMREGKRSRRSVVGVAIVSAQTRYLDDRTCQSKGNVAVVILT